MRFLGLGLDVVVLGVGRCIRQGNGRTVWVCEGGECGGNCCAVSCEGRMQQWLSEGKLIDSVDLCF